MAPSRTRALNVRLLDREHDMLAELASEEGVSISEWIRNVIRKEHAIAMSAKKQRRR